MLLYVLLATGFFVNGGHGLEAREQLYRDLFVKYNKVPRPVKNVTDKVTIKFGIAISQLIDVDEKNQVLTTSVWLRQEWFDYKLNWEPEDYGNLTYIRVPSTEIWVPDVVLYNNADGKFEVTSYTRAQVFYDGTVRWVPPAIYKSYCYIDVRFFPFDQQNCSMKFGTWTYDYTLVDMIPWGDRKVNRDDFRETGEWVIIDAPVYRHVENYECCPPYVDVTAYLVIQRLPLFFTINLIVPCVLFSFISLFVFYLPSRGQKITLSISVLLSISVFLLVIFNTIPSTSFAIPLIGKYLLFTATLVTLSIVATVFVLNVYHRSGSTHQMPPWVRMIFLQKLPTMLCMRRPRSKGKESDINGSQTELEENKIATAIKYVKLRRLRMAGRRVEEKEEDYAGFNTKTVEAPEEAKPALEGLEYVASFLKRQDKCDALEEDWKYVAMIIDRIFLWMFVSACLVGTCSIFIEPWMQDDIHGADN